MNEPSTSSSDNARRSRVPNLDQATLAQYLNDHLAGSVAALKLMGRVSDAYANEPLGVLMLRLRADLEYEQGLLRDLLGALDAPESQVAQALAWVGEQFARFKIGAGDDDISGLMLFEALEALAMGFFGRMSLFKMLAIVRESLPLDIDFAGLAERASLHLEELEAARVTAGRAALSSAVTAVSSKR